MKRVVLIGDSIRIGYQEIVRRELEGQAELRWPDQNGGTSRNVLSHLEEWVFAQAPQIVHLNCGLHDLRKEFGAQQPAVPLPEYRANLESIFERILAQGTIQLIWATTTPVNEVWHHENKPFDRFEADVLAYNAESLAVCRRFGVPVNDLYEVIMAAGRDSLLAKDGVHYEQAGYELLGRAVAQAIRAYL